MKNFTILFLLLLSSVLYSQTWTLQTTIPGASGGFNSMLAVNTNVCWISGAATQVYKTTNGGTNWLDVHGNLVGVDAYSIYALDEQHAWIGAGDGSIYFTTNGGTNWTYAVPIPSSPFIDVVHMFDLNNGFAIGDPASSQWRYYITTNGGTTYTLGTNAPAAGTSTEAGWDNCYWTVDTGHIGWGTNNYRIYHGGWKGPITFTTVSAQSQFGFAFEYGCTGYALFESSTPSQLALEKTTDCATWFATPYTPPSNCFGIDNAPTVGVFEYWLTGTTGIYYSSDGGANWSIQFPITSAGYCISMVNVQCGWAGGASGQIWKYSSPHPVGISNNRNEIPTEYSLSQNYPNPFNPSTTINFALPKASDVSLKIYDILGNEVMAVINGYRNAGNHSVNVNASSLASGVYFYKLVAGSFTESKKMILAK